MKRNLQRKRTGVLSEREAIEKAYNAKPDLHLEKSQLSLQTDTTAALVSFSPECTNRGMEKSGIEN